MDKAIKRIEAERKKLELSLREASESAGIAAPYWHQIVSGARTPTWDTLAKMARAVRLDVKIVLEER